MPSKRAAGGEIAVCAGITEWAFEGELKHSRQDGVGAPLSSVGIFRMRKVGDLSPSRVAPQEMYLLSPQDVGQEFFYFYSPSR